MQPTELGVKALADHLAVADDDRADQRVRAHPAAPALRQLQGPTEVDPILVCGHCEASPIDWSVNQ